MLSADHKMPTALLDLDVHFGTGALTLDLEPGRGLTDAIDNPSRIDGLFIERAMIRANDNLAILSAEAPINAPLLTDGTAFMQLAEEFRHAFDATVVDLPRNMLINFPQLLANMQVVIVVTELTLCGARDGIRILVIDPWNEVEHARPRAESETEYHNRALRMIRRFASRYGVIAIVIAHPTKDVAKEGKLRMPGLYDIAGSGAWYNKPDHGIVVHVPDSNTNETIVSIKKVRFSWSGKKADVTLTYLPEIEGYASMNGQFPIWKALLSAG
jgi:hypothetical protein